MTFVYPHRPAETTTLPLTSTAVRVALSEDGRWAATVDESGAIQLWDLESRQPLGSPINAGLGPSPVAFTPDAQHLVQTGEAATVWINVDRDTWTLAGCGLLGDSPQSSGVGNDGEVPCQ